MCPGVRGVGNGDEVRWKSRSPLITGFTVDFDVKQAHSCPFDTENDTKWQSGRQDSDRAGEVSGTPNIGGQPPVSCAYTLSIQVNAYGVPITVTVDPEVVVDDNTPPPAPGR
jgi:hypothetical protein